MGVVLLLKSSYKITCPDSITVGRAPNCRRASSLPGDRAGAQAEPKIRRPGPSQVRALTSSPGDRRAPSLRAAGRGAPAGSPRKGRAAREAPQTQCGTGGDRPLAKPSSGDAMGLHRNPWQVGTVTSPSAQWLLEQHLAGMSCRQVPLSPFAPPRPGQSVISTSQALSRSALEGPRAGSRAEAECGPT